MLSSLARLTVWGNPRDLLVFTTLEQVHIAALSFYVSVWDASSGLYNKQF